MNLSSTTEAENVMIDIGNGNLARSSRITHIAEPNAETMRRLKKNARANRTLIDACCGKVARSIIFFDSDHIAVSPLEKRKLVRLASATRARI